MSGLAKVIALLTTMVVGGVVIHEASKIVEPKYKQSVANCGYLIIGGLVAAQGYRMRYD